MRRPTIPEIDAAVDCIAAVLLGLMLALILGRGAGLI